MAYDLEAMLASKSEATGLNCGCLACQGKAGFIQRGHDGPELVGRAIPATVATTSDGTLNGVISPGEEVDFIGISVVAGQTYSVALRGAGATPLNDPLLALYDQNGNFLDFDDDGGAGITSLLTFTAGATGTYSLGAFAFTPGDVGGYTVDLWLKPPADEVPDTFAGAVTILNNGTTFGYIDSSNDIDTFKVFLEAGKLYTFELAGGADYNTDFAAVPPGELDTILGLYAPDGSFIGFNDDISFPGDISSGFSFFAQESGFYFLDALAYPGQVGGYTLDVKGINPADFDPRDSINWFDANNIPTVTVGGVKTAYVYFGDSDKNFGQTADDGGPMVTIDWNAYEKQQVMLALKEFELILGIKYEVTQDLSKATFRLLKTESEDYGAYFFPQDPSFGADQGVGVFNVLSGGWNFGNQQSLERGGYSFSVILHEFGHAHGLAHPHDNGGSSQIMLGVAGPDSLGIYDLNQGVYTVMSYNDGWETHPDGPSAFTATTLDNGWPATLSAFDIAVLQQRYGVTAAATGNNVYVLADTADDAFYQTIWDSAGTDAIAYNGARDVQIDLTAATLDYTPTGGGVVSFVRNAPNTPAAAEIKGGYTIANGVVIENATGGNGKDVLLGNAAANTLTGNGGDDFLMGRAGADRLDGGAGFDTASWADAAAGVRVTMGNNFGGSSSEGDTLISIEKVEGSKFDDQLDGGNSADTLFGMAGNDKIVGGNAADTLDGGDGDDLLEGGNDNDSLSGGNGNDVLDGGNGNDELSGGAGNDTLRGGNGNDVISAGAGVDTISGGNGKDYFEFDAAGTKTIQDYARGEKIDLSAFSSANVSIAANGKSIFVELGANDLTIVLQGGTVTLADLVFAEGANAAAFMNGTLIA